MLCRRGAGVVNRLRIDRYRRLCGFRVYRSDAGQGRECARAVCERKRCQKGDYRDRCPPQYSKSVEPHDLEVPRSAAHAIKIASGRDRTRATQRLNGIRET